MARTTKTDFQTFWDAYGLHRDRYAAERVWSRLSEKDRRAAVAGVAAYRDDCQRRGVRMMYGQGYLSHRRWEDEQDAGTNAPAVPSPSEPSLPFEMEKW